MSRRRAVLWALVDSNGNTEYSVTKPKRVRLDDLLLKLVEADPLADAVVRAAIHVYTPHPHGANWAALMIVRWTQWVLRVLGGQ